MTCGRLKALRSKGKRTNERSLPNTAGDAEQAAVDVGSAKIACFVLRFDGPERFRDAEGIGSMAGQSAFRVIGAATTRSRGVRFGEIERVDHVIACFSGAKPRSYGLTGSVELQDGQVSENCVARALASCDVPDYGGEREVLHAQPVNFAVDHRSGLGDPRGQAGNALSTDLHMLTIDRTPVENLLYCIKRYFLAGGRRARAWRGLY